MGALTKLIDTILFFFFMIVAIGAPAIHSQMFIPLKYFPEFLIDLKQWLIRGSDYYLFDEMPNFFVGLAWLELLFQCPLSIANLYGIIAGKSWLSLTCLVYGVSTFTSMAAILGEFLGSGKASEKLLKMYFPFVGFVILAILRGLLPQSGKTTTVERTPLQRKKRV